MKFYYVAAALYVGVDIAKEGLYSAVDGAISRYNQQRKKKPNFPKMHFIHADCGTKLHYDDQNRALGGMNQENKILIDKFFNIKSPTKFDVINCQFVIHYLLANQTTWDNLKYNVNLVLKEGGYFIMTHFDAEQVLKYLGDKNSAAGYYTDDKGKKEKLFEIVKKFGSIDKSKPIGPGHAIDLYAAWMFEDGSYQTEYLVDYKFLEQDLLKDCDLELVETDLFENQFKMNKEFFAGKYCEAMHNPETRKFLENVAEYYQETEINKTCYEYSFLQRYCIFRKKDKAKPSNMKREVSRAEVKEESKENQKGGVVEYKLLSKTKYDDSYSFMNSIHYILQSHQIIPKTLKVREFFKEHGLKMIKDTDLKKTDMNNICKSVKISHEFSVNSELSEMPNTQNVVDGLYIQQLQNNKLTDLVKPSDKSKNKIMILTKEEGVFNPVYIKYDNMKQGMFKADNTIIGKMF
jgi:SAM-dependent methyltransferase